MRHIPLAVAAFLALAAPGANAGDPALEALLKAADIPFEVDKDGDYKIVYDWSKDKRSQLVYVAGTAEEVDGVKLYEIFSPAKVIDNAGIDPLLAKRLLEQNGRYKFGAWEVAGETLYFGGKVPVGIAASPFETLVSLVAGVADDMELELSPGKDDL
ncbi:MAG TPA: hypothetical protein VLC71_02710 [Thermomonas sp.]|nr:hypothetical protein [Thermomonas sp.]